MRKLGVSKGIWAAAGLGAAAAGLGAMAAAGLRTAVLRRDRTEEQWEAKLNSRDWCGRREEMRADMTWYARQPKEEVSIVSRDSLQSLLSHLQVECVRAVFPADGVKIELRTPEVSGISE